MRKMFSKNQIEEMIQSGVKSGATKLYQHNVTLDDEVDMQVINTSSDSLVGEDIADIFADTIQIKYASGDYEIMLAAVSGTGFYYLNNGSISLLEFDSLEILTDEVIPL